MLCFAVVFVFAAVASIQGMTIDMEGDEFTNALAKCNVSSPLSENALLNIRDRFIKGEPIEERQFFCFVNCFLKELDVLKEDGALKTESIIDQIPPELPARVRFVNALKECGAKTASDPCDSAKLIFNCMYDTNLLYFVTGV